MAKYIFTYDISDQKRLNKVAKKLEKVALRIQYSVFEFEGTEKEVDKLLKSIEKIIDKEEDRVFVYPISYKKEKRVIRLGKLKNFPII